MNVLVLSRDRRFREVAAVLLARRGCKVAVGDGVARLSQRLERERTEVVVIDAGRSLAAAARMAAAVQALSRPVGIVLVEDHPKPALPQLQTVSKWGSFPELFAAIESAHDMRALRVGPVGCSNGAHSTNEVPPANHGAHS